MFCRLSKKTPKVYFKQNLTHTSYFLRNIRLFNFYYIHAPGPAASPLLELIILKYRPFGLNSNIREFYVTRLATIKP